MRITNTVLVLASWAGWFALSRWQKSISEILDPINPHLADVILVGLFLATGIVWWYDNKKNSPERKSHSKKLVKAIEILSKGHYGEYLVKTEFLIPYPIFHYNENKRKVDFMTVSESIELFNKNDWSDVLEEKQFEFVPITKSNEGDFEQAIDHLKSYKHIKQMQEKAKIASEEFGKCLHEKQKEVGEINQKYLKLDSPELHPFYPQYKKLLDNYADSKSKLQESLEIIASHLDDGKIIKGKCSKCP